MKLGALAAVLCVACAEPGDRSGPDAADTSDALDTRVGLDAIEVEPSTPDDGLAIVLATDGVFAPKVAVRGHIAWSGHTAADIVEERWVITPPLGPAPRPQLTAPAAGGGIAFDATVVGDWVVSAVILDRDGAIRHAQPSNFRVAAPGRLYVQVTWRTPGDLDESDTGGDFMSFSVGSDVDLHLLHPAAGGFFDLRYDAFFGNLAPEWGTASDDDDPVIVRDDSDGAGPEAAWLRRPEPGATYTVGVHYYSDWGFGPAFATVRVYLSGALADEVADVRLVSDDFWASHTIGFGPDGAVELARVGDTPAITPHYVSLGAPPGQVTPAGHPALFVPSGELAQLGGRLTVLASASGVAARSFQWEITLPDETVEHVDGGWQLERSLDAVGDYRFAVTMRDQAGHVVADLATDVLVRDATSIRLTLVWETPGDPDPDDVGDSKDDAAGSDLDLHLVRAGAALSDAVGDCSYASPRPRWTSTPTNADDPMYQRDDVDGIGPEVISWLAPQGSADVVVVYADDHGWGPSLATVRAYVDNELVARRSETLVSGDVLNAFSIVDGVVVSPDGGAP